MHHHITHSRPSPPPSKPPRRRIFHPHRTSHKPHAPKRNTEPQSRTILLHDSLPLIRIDRLHNRTTKRQSNPGPNLKRGIDHSPAKTLHADRYGAQ